MDLIRKCGVEVTIGLVQTAYANGASTDYIQNVLVSLVRGLALLSGEIFCKIM